MEKFITLVFAIAILFSSCGESKVPVVEQQTEEKMQGASKAELSAAIAERDQLIDLMNKISSDMDQIKQLENILTLSNTNGEIPSQRQEIEANIAAIQETLESRREQLAELEARLNQSSLNNRTLQNSIENLRNQIDSQSAEIETLRANLEDANLQISELNIAVDSLTTTVTTVTEERNLAQEETTELANELNVCYYVAASKKELKSHKIIETGFLRKTKLMKGDFDQSFFVTGDRRTLTTIPLYTKKAKVLTNHPESSYRIIEQQGQKVLRITNPDLFWSLTNYLVIQID